MAHQKNAIKTNSTSKVDIGITVESRAEVAGMLSQLLADQHTLYIKTRNYHWNVTGMQFQSLHELFEEQYDDLAEYIDETAERIRSLGFFAPGSMDAFKSMARLVETDHVDGNAQAMLKNLLNDHETIIQILRNDQEEAMDKYGDAGTQDFLIGMMEGHEKMAWMLRAHLA
jgi:starvation-inducible DNA-binding protein